MVAAITGKWKLGWEDGLVCSHGGACTPERVTTLTVSGKSGFQ